MRSRVVTAAEMREAEAAAFARGTTPEKLMDEAAAGIAAAVAMFFPTPGHCIVFAGKGNNGADALAAAKLLQRDGWSIDLRLAYPEAELGELPRKHLARLRGATSPAKSARGNTIVLDGLLGVGATPPLREPIRGECRAINRWRADTGAYVFAIDLPTGMESDSGDIDADCVVADFTLTIGFAKRGLIVDRALNHVGRLRVIPLAELSDEEELGDGIVTDRESLRHALLRRPFGAYKNEFGRVGIVAGSKGFTGAALFCSLGALRAGAGLVELFVPEDIYPTIATSAAPEVMVKPISSYDSLGSQPIDVWAVGPGLGREHDNEVRRLIARTNAPMVLDADALNLVAQDMSVLSQKAAPRLLTPHPGEMKRIFSHQDASRAEIAEAFCAKYAATLLCKGSRTIVAERGRPISYNTTGNPGMATGGMGDVLTGVCAALVAQKLSLYDSARCGAWLCGRAAEIAIFNGDASEQSLLPSDVLDCLGAATKELQAS